MQTPIEPVNRTAGDVIVNTTAWFSAEMRSKLFDNMYKGGWRSDRGLALLARLREEADELERAIKNGAPWDLIVGEAADVANFAMMIADPGREEFRRT